MHDVVFEDLRVQYTVEVRPRRRHPALRFEGGTTLTLLLPKGFTPLRGEEFVRTCEAWIRRQVARGIAPHPLRTFADGEDFRILDRPYRLEVVRTGRRAKGAIATEDGRIVVTLRDGQVEAQSDTVRRQLVRLYTSLATGIIEDRVASIAPKVGRMPRGIGIRTYRSSWGYCRGDRTLSFNWRLVQAPGEVVDYVVTHELAHLWHMDHGREFWRLVESHLPDYRTRRAWLRQYGNQLVW